VRCVRALERIQKDGAQKSRESIGHAEKTPPGRNFVYAADPSQQPAAFSAA
jgi:hypothetical protein